MHLFAIFSYYGLWWVLATFAFPSDMMHCCLFWRIDSIRLTGFAELISLVEEIS
jgi:hypothetical protein